VAVLVTRSPPRLLLFPSPGSSRSGAPPILLLDAQQGSTICRCSAGTQAPVLSFTDWLPPYSSSTNEPPASSCILHGQFFQPDSMWACVFFCLDSIFSAIFRQSLFSLMHVTENQEENLIVFFVNYVHSSVIIHHVLPPFQNIRCFSFVKQMYLNIF
jgi:hypothetical protein